METAVAARMRAAAAKARAAAAMEPAAVAKGGPRQWSVKSKAPGSTPRSNLYVDVFHLRYR